MVLKQLNSQVSCTLWPDTVNGVRSGLAGHCQSRVSHLKAAGATSKLSDVVGRSLHSLPYGPGHRPV